MQRPNVAARQGRAAEGTLTDLKKYGKLLQ